MERVWSAWRVHLQQQRRVYALAGAVRMASQSRAMSSHLAFLRAWSHFMARASGIVASAAATRRFRMLRICVQVRLNADDVAVVNAFAAMWLWC